MALPLLRTKLYVPPIRPELVSRPRLVERLNAGLHQKLTLLSAPAGFGKTTLLSEWVSGCGRAVAWVSLDKTDNDLARFWTYVIAALQTIPALSASGVGESALVPLQSPQPPPMRTLLIELINEITGATGDITGGTSGGTLPSLSTVGEQAHAPEEVPGRSLVLVLDDFHVITDAQVHDTLAFLLDNLPPQMHVVIATRSDPLLPLSRLRGRAQLTELGAADLRFTAEEATVFLNRVMGLGLSAEDIGALETRTEGWIVGLQMAAYALQGTLSASGRDAARVSEYISAFTGSHRYVLDYLTDEVLVQEPESVQAFLLQTSILDRLSGSLCDAITGLKDGQQMLERLDAANLFIVPLDDERRWYRYHHLFADLLRRRLNKTHADLVPGLHRRASAWFERANLIEEAIGHALAGEDFERAARLVEQNAMQQMIGFRREATLAGWLEALPDDVVRARPWLCVYLAWTRHWMGLREQIEECLQHAEQALERAAEDGEPTTDGTLIAGYIAAIRAHHALTHQQIERVVEMAQRAIAFLPEGDYMRCEAAVALGGAYWSLGDVVASEKAFSQARATAQRSGYRLLGVPASCYTGMQQAKQGRLDEAYATYHEALEWATEPGGRPLPIAGFPLIRLGDLAREWNDLEAAGRDLATGLELCVQLGHADVLAEGYVLLARLQLAQGEFDRALDSLDQAEQISQRVKIDPWITAWADDCRLRLWLSTGDVAAAAHWAQTSGLSVDGELSYQHDLHHVNLARVLIAPGAAHPGQRDLSQALDLLARLQLAARKAGWVSEEIKILILQALGYELRGDRTEALAALEHALLLAEPCGYVRTFVEEGSPLAHLLRQEAGRGIVPGYVGQLLAALGDEAALDELAAAAPTGAPIEALSERETEVLALIAQGLTNREIGERLFISLGTVKAHTSSIYGKLGVRSRTQAVAQARALGIL